MARPKPPSPEWWRQSEPEPEEKPEREEKPDPKLPKPEGEPDEPTEPAEPPSPELPEPTFSESERRELRAEVEFRRRVELSEVANRLPAETRRRVLESLQHYDGEWHLERRRYLYNRLVRERVLESAGRVVVEQRFALRRDNPPPTPEALDETVAQAVLALERDTPESALDRVQAALPPEDELVVTIDPPPDAPAEAPRRLRVTAEGVSLLAVEGPPIASGVEPSAGDSSEPPDSPAISPAPESAPELELGGGPVELPPQEDAAVEEAVRAVWEEPDEPRSPEIPSTSQSEPAEVPETPPAPAAESAPQPTPLESALAELADHLDELVSPDLPQAAGGSGEVPDERRRRRHPPRMTTAKHSPSRATVDLDPLLAIKPSREGERRVYAREREWSEPRQVPDRRLRRKARKLVRILARRYGIRLTPELEAYLLEIMLRPDTVRGRRVYGLGLHRETLLRTLAVLQVNFGDLYAIRPRPQPDS